MSKDLIKAGSAKVGVALYDGKWREFNLPLPEAIDRVRGMAANHAVVTVSLSSREEGLAAVDFLKTLAETFSGKPPLIVQGPYPLYDERGKQVGTSDIPYPPPSTGKWQVTIRNPGNPGETYHFADPRFIDKRYTVETATEYIKHDSTTLIPPPEEPISIPEPTEAEMQSIASLITLGGYELESTEFVTTEVLTVPGPNKNGDVFTAEAVAGGINRKSIHEALQAAAKAAGKSNLQFFSVTPGDGVNYFYPPPSTGPKTLKEHLLSRRGPLGFSDLPRYHEGLDAVDCYLENVVQYTDPVRPEFHLFRAMDDDRIVGYRIFGARAKLFDVTRALSAEHAKPGFAATFLRTLTTEHAVYPFSPHREAELRRMFESIISDAAYLGQKALLDGIKQGCDLLGDVFLEAWACETKGAESLVSFTLVGTNGDGVCKLPLKYAVRVHKNNLGDYPWDRVVAVIQDRQRKIGPPLPRWLDHNADKFMTDKILDKVREKTGYEGLGYGDLWVRITDKPADAAAVKPGVGAEGMVQFGYLTRAGEIAMNRYADLIRGPHAGHSDVSLDRQVDADKPIIVGGQ